MKIKKVIKFLPSLILAVPFLASAQWWGGDDYGLPSGSIFGIIENILEWLLAMLGIAGVLGFAISGIMYLISAGDDEMISRAKKGMQYSIMGVIVGLLGFVVIQAVDLMLNASDNRF